MTKTKKTTKSIIRSKKKEQESGYKLWKRCFFDRKFGSLSIRLYRKSIVWVSMWEGRVFFYLARRAILRIIHYRLKNKTLLPNETKIRNSPGEKWKNSSCHALLLYTGCRQQEIQIILISGDHSFLINAAVENLLNGSQENVVIDRVIPCSMHFFQIRLFS